MTAGNGSAQCHLNRSELQPEVENGKKRCVDSSGKFPLWVFRWAAKQVVVTAHILAKSPVQWSSSGKYSLWVQWVQWFYLFCCSKSTKSFHLKEQQETRLLWHSNLFIFCLQLHSSNRDQIFSLFSVVCVRVRACACVSEGAASPSRCSVKCWDGRQLVFPIISHVEGAVKQTCALPAAPLGWLLPNYLFICSSICLWVCVRSVFNASQVCMGFIWFWSDFLISVVCFLCSWRLLGRNLVPWCGFTTISSSGGPFQSKLNTSTRSTRFWVLVCSCANEFSLFTRCVALLIHIVPTLTFLICLSFVIMSWHWNMPLEVSECFAFLLASSFFFVCQITFGLNRRLHFAMHGAKCEGL